MSSTELERNDQSADRAVGAEAGSQTDRSPNRLDPRDGDLLCRAPPPELLVLDTEEPCPYLPDRQARMPLRLPVRPLSRKELDGRLARGDRRWGRLLYRPSCAGCQACEPLRIDLHSFRPSRSQRRAMRRGQQGFEVELGPLMVDEERLALFEKHKRVRNLSREPALLEEQYNQFLVDRCCESFEVRCRYQGRLASVAITDRAHDSLNAVYTFFDPDLERSSPGTFSILTQIAIGRDWRLRYLYLGLYVADNRHMSYKARFRPHQRLLDGDWRSFD